MLPLKKNTSLRQDYPITVPQLFRSALVLYLTKYAWFLLDQEHK